MAVYHFKGAMILLTILVGCGSEGDGGNSSPDTSEETPFTWKTATPESVGMDSAALQQAVAFIESEGLDIRSVLVVKRSRIVLERYFGGDTAETLYNIESSTKSILSLLVGMAVDDGLLPQGAATPVLTLFPEKTFAAPSAEKSAMTVEDLLTMRSGLAYDNNTESFQQETDPVQLILDHPMAEAPGSVWSYSSADTQLLAAIVAKQSGMSLRSYAEEKLFSRVGIHPGEWMQDGSGLEIGGYGLMLTTRDMGRIGLLALHGGVWDGAQLVSKQWIDASFATHAVTPWSRGDFGYLWWIKRFEGICAGGRYGQQINFFPDRDLVVVYTAALPLETADSVLDYITRTFFLGDESLTPPDAGVQDPGAVTCDNTASEWFPTTTLAPHGQGVFTFGDGISTICVDELTANRICLKGDAADAGSDYEYWGAGFGIGLAPADENGTVTAPFDAAAAGIHGARFTVEGTDTLPFGLRVGITMVDEPGLPYAFNPFIMNGGDSGNVKTDGVTELSFDDLKQPFWSDLPSGTVLDPAKVHALRFQTSTQPVSPYSYGYCISGITWLDESGTPLP